MFLRAALILSLVTGCDDDAPADPPAPTDDPDDDPPPVEVTPLDRQAETDAVAAEAEAAAEDTPAPPAFADVTAESDAPEPLAASACEASAPVRLGATEARRPGIVATAAGDGFVVVWATDETTAQVVRTDVAGAAGEPESISIPAAMDLASIDPLGDRFVVRTHGLCPGTTNAMKCYQLAVLGPDLAPIGEPLQHQTGEWASGPFVFTPDGFVVLRSHTYAPPVLARYRLGADGSLSREELGDLSHGVVRGDDPPPQAVALAVDGDRIAAIVKTQDDREELHLHVVGRDSVRVRGLSPTLTSPHMAFVGDTLQLVVQENSRSRLVILGLDGEVRDGPKALGPEPYGEVSAYAAGERAPATLQRQDRAGRAVGERVGDLPASRTAAAAGSGDTFLIATVEGSGTPRDVVARSVSCR